MSQTSIGISFQKLFARAFTFIFLILSSAIILPGFITAMESFLGGSEETPQIVIKVINSCIIAIAIFELAMVIDKEYANTNEHDVVVMLRRTLPRFIGTVCVALALEGLIMVIKYSQLDLAGNLYYPVAIILSAAILLISLGIFLKLVP